MKLYLIRHGRQDSSLCNVNVPLSEVGRKQAELLGKRLQNYEIDALYSSDLIRAVETAEIVNQYLNLEHKIEPDMKEMSFGDLEGLTDEEIVRDYGEFIKERRMMKSDLAYPNGENGAMVFRRAYPALRNIIRECQEKNAENVVIVTHGGLIRAMLAGILGMDFAGKLMFAKELENTGITQLDYHKDDLFTVERINDYAHIEKEEGLLRKHFVHMSK